MTLHLTPAECQWFAANLSPSDVWPPSDQMDLLEGKEHRAGGTRFRARILSIAIPSLDEEDAGLTVPFTLSTPEVWLLDAIIVPFTPADKLPDGTPLRSLAEKVWALAYQTRAGDEDVFDENIARWDDSLNAVKETCDAYDH